MRPLRSWPTKLTCSMVSFFVNRPKRPAFFLANLLAEIWLRRALRLRHPGIYRGIGELDLASYNRRTESQMRKFIYSGKYKSLNDTEIGFLVHYLRFAWILFVVFMFSFLIFGPKLG